MLFYCVNWTPFVAKNDGTQVHLYLSFHCPLLERLTCMSLFWGSFFFLGNRSRGQADGFGIEILAKLRDVKTKVL